MGKITITASHGFTSIANISTILSVICRMKRSTTLLPILLLLIGFGCSPATEPVSYTTGPVEVTLMGPLFEGANTAQQTISPDFDQLLPEGKTVEDIVSVSLTSASFTSQDSIPFDNWQEMVVQFVSDNSPMVNAAVQNPISIEEGSISMSGATEADLGEIFKDGAFYLVCDVNLGADVMDDQQFTADLTFTLQVK